MLLKVVIDGFGIESANQGSHDIEVNDQDPFLDTAVSILVLLVTKGVLPPFVELNSIAFLSFMRQLLKAEDYQKTTKQISIEFGEELFLVEREEVSGPDLSTLKSRGHGESIKASNKYGFMSQFTSEKRRVGDEEFEPIHEAGALMADKVDEVDEVPPVVVSDLDSSLEKEKEMPPAEVREELEALRSELGMARSPPAGIASPQPSVGSSMPSTLGGGISRARQPSPSLPKTAATPAVMDQPSPPALMDQPSPPALMDQPSPPAADKAVPDTAMKRKAEKKDDARSLEEAIPASAAGEYDKNVAVEYFEIMNPQKVYPLVIDLNNAEIKTKATKENIVTGERQVQKKGEMHVSLESPAVTVVPVFPGCVVAPTSLKTNFDKEKDKLTFYITPLVQDDVNGYVEFTDSKGDQFHKIDLKAEIKDPRYAKLVALYGVLSSVAPKVMEFLGINLFALDMTSVLPAISAVFSELSLGNLIAITGIIAAIIIALIYYARQRDKMAVKRFYMRDFRLQALDMLK